MWEDDAHGGRRTDCDDMLKTHGRKMVMEKTSYSHEEPLSRDRDDGGGQVTAGESLCKFGTGKQKQMLVRKNDWEGKESAFTEVRQGNEKRTTEEGKELEEGRPRVAKTLVQSSPRSAFSFVWPNRAAREPKSAFSKPVKFLMDRRAVTISHHLGGLVKCPGQPSGSMSPSDIIWYRSLLTSKFLMSDVDGSQLLQDSLVQNNLLPCASGLHRRQVGDQMQIMHTSSSSSTSSFTLLPPTFTSFGLAAQNWCAKCNLFFRMTSDLVFHMRCHHKKDGVSPGSYSKRRREEKLTCPICQEHFRERHHLSRHMTSHN